MFGNKRVSMLEAGSRAPAFELKDLNGGHESLQAILKKGPAAIAFFKIGCPVCQLTFPFLERLAGQGTLHVVGISQDDANATRNFNHRFGVTFPTLLDESRAGYPVSNAFGISSVPSIFVVEQDGTISTVFAGFSKRDLQGLGDRIGVQPFSPDEKVPEMRAG